MTRAKYIAETNELQELPAMEKPLLYNTWLEFKKTKKHLFLSEGEANWIKEYDNHVNGLRTIPCSPECRGLFENGKVYEEGKDYEVKDMEVDIHAPVGTKVKGNFVGGTILGGYDHHKAKAMKHLKPDTIYEIESTFISGWHTDFYFKEVPGVAFNSVQFIYPEPMAFPLPIKSEDFAWTDELVKEYAEQYRFSSSRISIEQFKYSLTKR